MCMYFYNSVDAYRLAITGFYSMKWGKQGKKVKQFKKSKMKPPLLSVVLLLHFFATPSRGTNSTKTGCNLRVPKEVHAQMEPEGDPLKITFKFQPMHVRDVPGSGGAFGVDFW